MSKNILAPISIGELYDKISILEIKSTRIGEQNKLANVNYEMQLLKEIAGELDVDYKGKAGFLFLKLKEINTEIWEAQEKIRSYECRGVFDEMFLETVRLIHRLNEARSAVKRDLNILTGSSIVEEKSYS